MAESVNSQSLSAVTEGHDDRIKTAETEQHLTEQAKYPQHKQIKLQQNNNKNYNQERTSSSNGSSSSPTILQSHLKSSSSKSAASTSSGSKRTHSKSRITPRKETRTGTERTTDNISPNSCNRSSSRSTLNNNSGSIPVASSSVIDDQPNTTQSAVSLGLRTNTATNLTDSTTKYTAQQKEHNGVFNGPDIRKLIKTTAFHNSLNEKELNAWNAIKDVITVVLGKHRGRDIREKVEYLMRAFDELGVHMSLKIHFLHHHMDWFEHQLSTESDEQGERFHQVAFTMETRYKGKKLQRMLADLCWWLQITNEDDNTNDEEDPENEREGYSSDELNLPASKKLKL